MLLRTELEGRTHLITLIRLRLSVYYYPGCDWNPDPKIRPVVHEKQLSGSQIRISIRITPNFELRLPMIITSLLTKFRQNPTSSLWEILLTNKQTNRQTDTRRWRQYPAFRGIIKMQVMSGNYFVSFHHASVPSNGWEWLCSSLVSYGLWIFWVHSSTVHQSASSERWHYIFKFNYCYSCMSIKSGKKYGFLHDLFLDFSTNSMVILKIGNLC